MTISKLIKNTRQAQGISLSDFALKTGIDEKDLEDIELGEKVASFKELEIISKVLEQNVEYFS